MRTRDRFVIVPAADVEWIAAAGNYAELHLAEATHGDYDVVLVGGAVLKLSRRYRARVLG